MVHSSRHECSLPFHQCSEDKHHHQYIHPASRILLSFGEKCSRSQVNIVETMDVKSLHFQSIVVDFGKKNDSHVVVRFFDLRGILVGLYTKLPGNPLGRFINHRRDRDQAISSALVTPLVETCLAFKETHIALTHGGFQFENEQQVVLDDYIQLYLIRPATGSPCLSYSLIRSTSTSRFSSRILARASR